MVKLDKISFSYKKKVPILEDVNLQINKGDIFGILGHNGAGKTTLFRIMLGLVKPQMGNVEISTSLREIEYVPEEAGIYLKMSAVKNILFRAEINHVSNGQNMNNIINLLQQVSLDGRMEDSTVENWSNGMKKRLAIVCSLVTNPKILFLDEPTNGLDPESLKIIREILLAENRKGMTIVINSHDLNTVSDLCNRIAIIQNGKKYTKQMILKMN